MAYVPKRPFLSIDEKQALIADYLQSSLSLKAYVKEHGIGLSTLTKWATQLGISLHKKSSPSLKAETRSQRQQAPLFVDLTSSLKAVALDTANALSLVIALPGGVTLTLPRLSPGQVVAVVKGLL